MSMYEKHKKKEESIFLVKTAEGLEASLCIWKLNNLELDGLL